MPRRPICHKFISILSQTKTPPTRPVPTRCTATACLETLSTSSSVPVKLWWEIKSTRQTEDTLFSFRLTPGSPSCQVSSPLCLPIVVHQVEVVDVVHQVGGVETEPAPEYSQYLTAEEQGRVGWSWSVWRLELLWSWSVWWFLWNKWFSGDRRLQFLHGGLPSLLFWLCTKHRWCRFTLSSVQLWVRSKKQEEFYNAMEPQRSE